MNRRTANPAPAFPTDGIERLAERILAGEVVFFIGAGFSVDSEANTANVLIARLLARFDALTRCLTELGGEHREKADGLRNELQHTFGLNPAEGFVSDAWVRKLAGQYYPINDWFCSAFGELLGHIGASPRLAQVIDLDRIGVLERQGLSGAGGTAAMPSSSIKLDSLLQLPSPAAGKALFLDTMGFADLAVMGGKPCDPDLVEVKKSYGNRLLDRHHVLARFAMEGWCPLLLTTNYDLLIEGAYRLTGMEPGKSGMKPRNGRCDEPSLDTTYGQFNRIAAAGHYFASGSGHRTAQIVKMHGCVDAYRENRNGTPEAWHAYLPAMVFTYREIQNWREDAWSRDMLRSLLRTRTLAFCSYSGQDPVIHDTVRSVYEEMAEKRAAEPTPTNPAPPAATSAPPATDADKARQAPAFVFDVSDQGNFHQQEILRAAAKVAGVKHPPRDCRENLLGFYFRNDKGRRFPTIDELFRWLFHRSLRKRQRQVLRSHLPTVLTALLNRPCHADELAELSAGFDKVCNEELRLATAWDTGEESRRACGALCAWSDGFHVALLREMAAAEILRQNIDTGLSVRKQLGGKMAVPWYCPTLDHPDWAAWAVVVELALRRIAAHWRGTPDAWVESSCWLTPGAGPLGAQVDISGGPERPTPIRITLGVEDIAKRARDGGHALRRHLHWRLVPGGIPWARDLRPTPQCGDCDRIAATENRRSAEGLVPNAAQLWTIARVGVSAGCSIKDFITPSKPEVP